MIVQRMNFKDTNKTNLIHTFEENSLNPLRRNGLISIIQKEGRVIRIKIHHHAAGEDES